MSSLLLDSTGGGVRLIATNGGTDRRAVAVSNDDGTIKADDVVEAEDGDVGRGALINAISAGCEQRRVAD